MNRVRIDDVTTPESISGADVVRPLSEALGAEGFAINVFELAPGDTVGFDYHRHLDQEEAFLVLRGTLTFETEADEVAVAADEVVRFAPGEFQLGRNRGDERVVVLAVGAPAGSTEIEYLRECPECAGRTIQVPELDEAASTLTIRCSDCDAAVETFSR